MKKANIGGPDFVWDDSDPEGFRAGMARLGGLLGAAESGISVYELPPGQAICPYHYECGEEGWLLVLSGAPTLRTPAGEERLAPWTGDPETSVMVRLSADVGYYEGEA